MLAGKTILIVADDANASTLFYTILQSHGYSVTTVRTGKEALAEIQKSYYNMTLFDVELPDMGGIELLENLRAANHDMVIIMITGNLDLEFCVSSINHGADGYLVKPVNDRDLVTIIERKLKQQEDTQKLTDEKVSEWLKSRLSRLTLENENSQL